MTEASPIDQRQLDAYFVLIEVASLLRHAVEQQLSDVGGLSYVQFQLLATLHFSDDPSQRMTDLADGMVYSRSGLTYQVGLLEKRGLVERTPSEHDGRGITVTITKAGRTVVKKVMPGHTEVLDQLLLSHLSKKQAVVLTDLLLPVRDHMRAAPPRSAAPRRSKRG